MPSKPEKEELEVAGLQITDDGTGLVEPITFTITWTASQVDSKLRQYFPKVFEYLDRKSPLQSGQMHWTLCDNYYKTVRIVKTLCDQNMGAMGRDLFKVRRPTTKGWKDQRLIFGMYICTHSLLYLTFTLRLFVSPEFWYK